MAGFMLVLRTRKTDNEGTCGLVEARGTKQQMITRAGKWFEVSDETSRARVIREKDKKIVWELKR